MLFAKAGRGIPKPLPVHLYVEPRQWVDTTPYFGGEKVSGRLGVLGTLLHRSGLSISNGVLLYKQMMSYELHVPCMEIRRSLTFQETASASVQVSSHCHQCTLVHL